MKRLVAILITAIMLIGMMGTFAFADGEFAIKVEPAVFLTGSIYDVVWSTTDVGIGYVEYEYGGRLIRVYDEEQGCVRTDDYIHTVSIPVEELDAAGAYTVTSVKVTGRDAYSATLGESVTATRTFTGYHGQEQINMWTFSDIHRTPTNAIMRAVHLTCGFLQGGDPDLVVLNGDIANHMNTKDYAEICIFDTAAQLTGGTIPCVYVRGNHETRGNFAPYFLQYLPSDTGEFYFTFEYGPISSIVVDMGEDKIDTHYEYHEQTNYEDYRRQETEWLESLGGFTGTPTYRIPICHGPNIKQHFKYNWLQFLSDWGTDVLVSGHFHGVGWWTPDGDNASYCIDFPIFQEGSHVNNTQFRGGQLIFKNGNIHYYVTNDSGENLLEGDLQAGLNLKSGQTLGAGVPDVADEPEIVTEGRTVTTVGAAPDFGFTCKPTVFDTGDCYTVAFATSPAYDSTADVYVKYDGREIRFSDAESGALRTGSNVHAVRIPKRYLDGNSYEVVSKKITSHSGFYATLSTEITTGFINFTGYAGQDEIKMLQVGSFASDPAQFDRVRRAASGYDVLLVSGDVVSNLDSAQKAADELLYRTGILTGGKIPVVFTRGETETFGEFSPYFAGVVRNSTRQFYEKVEYGPVTMLVLDTAGLYPDESALYNGLANFEPIRKKQIKWLAEQDYGAAEYKLALSHAAVLYDSVGYRYSRYLNDLGTDLAVFSHSSVSGLLPIGAHNQNYASSISGTFSGDGTVATLYTFKNGGINIKTLGENGELLDENDVDVEDNDATEYTDVTSDTWYASAVGYASRQRLMLGTAANEFSPEDALTRAQAITVVARMADADLTDAGDSGFADVDESAYYAAAVAWARRNGVTLGTAENTFSPDAQMTREQLCTMIYRLFGDRFAAADGCDFADFDAVSGYAKEAVAALAAAKVVNGMGDGRFAPKAAVTRAQLAQILKNGQF